MKFNKQNCTEQDLKSKVRPLLVQAITLKRYSTVKWDGMGVAGKAAQLIFTVLYKDHLHLLE